MSDSDDAYGPPLPPDHYESTLLARWIQQVLKPQTLDFVLHAKRFSRTAAESSSEEESYGPALPGMTKSDTSDKVTDKLTIGPVLPPHLQKKSKNHDESEDSDDDLNVAGPALPPHLVSNKSDTSQRYAKQKEKSRKVYGPVIPGHDDVDDDESDSDDNKDLIGPSVAMQRTGEDSSALEDFESRAQKMKDRLTGGDDKTKPVQRESWMTELPPEMGASYGLTSRTFRKNAGPTGDRSGWTDTPADRERKEKEGQKRKRDKDKEYVPTERDKDMAKQIDAYNKANRPDSLLEMHQKKQKKKKKKEKDKPKEREPFDRDRDLKVNKLDEAQRKAIIKRSQELGSRFQSGGTGTSFL